MVMWTCRKRKNVSSYSNPQLETVAHHSSSSYHHHPCEMNSEHLPNHLYHLTSIFTTLTVQVEQWEEQCRDPTGLLPKLLSMLAKPDPGLGGASALAFLGLVPHPTSSAPPTAPSLPQEELRLLRTSFDTAFASLAGQVTELAAKVLRFRTHFFLFHVIPSHSITCRPDDSYQLRTAD